MKPVSRCSGSRNVAKSMVKNDANGGICALRMLRKGRKSEGGKGGEERKMVENEMKKSETRDGDNYGLFFRSR